MIHPSRLAYVEDAEDVVRLFSCVCSLQALRSTTMLTILDEDRTDVGGSTWQASVRGN